MNKMIIVTMIAFILIGAIVGTIFAFNSTTTNTLNTKCSGDCNKEKSCGASSCDSAVTGSCACSKSATDSQCPCGCKQQCNGNCSSLECTCNK